MGPMALITLGEHSTELHFLAKLQLLFYQSRGWANFTPERWVAYLLFAYHVQVLCPRLWLTCSLLCTGNNCPHHPVARGRGKSLPKNNTALAHSTARWRFPGSWTHVCSTTTCCLHVNELEETSSSRKTVSKEFPSLVSLQKETKTSNSWYSSLTLSCSLRL